MESSAYSVCALLPDIYLAQTGYGRLLSGERPNLQKLDFSFRRAL